MLIKKQISYIAEIVVSAWIAKVDFVDGQSQFNYGFTVESEEEEQSTNET